MTQEKEIVGVGTGVEAAKPAVGSAKLSQGHLSFRSRKLLRSSLAKRSCTNNVDKPAALLPSTESTHLERSGTQSKVLNGQPTKACGKSGDPRTTNDDLANARTRSSSLQSKKLQGSLSVQDQQVDQKGSVKGEGVAIAPSARQLSPKSKLLETFYESLEAAYSLLRIRRQMCTFRAVCKIVESMSKRRFLLKHLAQIKHIFSEVLQLEYVRCQDPDDWGERWDLRVTLLPLSSDCPRTNSPLKGSAGQTAQTVRRRKEFHARLLRFESSHPEEGDIPLEPLPPRPFGSHSSNSQRAASPSSDRTSNSHCSTQGSLSEFSAQAPDTEPPIEIRTEDLPFSIVKPSRGNQPAPVAGTPHFLSSFRPFYSSIQTAEINRSVAPQSSEVVLPCVTLPLESHFPTSFKPMFSARPTSEGVACLPRQTRKIAIPDDSVLRSPCEEKHEEVCVESRVGDKHQEIGVELRVGDKHEEIGVELRVSDKHEEICVESRVCDKHEEIGIESRRGDKGEAICVESRVGSGDRFLTSRFDSVNSSSVSDNSSHFPPSTPVPSANSKELPPCSTDKGCPALHAVDLPVSPLPINTPPFLSPMNRILSSAQDSSNQMLCKTPLTNSSMDQRLCKTPLTNSSIDQRLYKTPLTNSSRDQVPPKSKGIMRALRFASPVRVSPAVKGEDSYTPQRIVNSAANTPPSDASNVRFEYTSVSTPSTPAHLLPRAPETPSLQTPIRINESKEVWYSPPKRTKLNLASLFTNDKDEHQETRISNSSIAGATEARPEAAGDRSEDGGDFGDGPQQEASISRISHPSAKDKEGISKSDLDVIQCLPHDIVQSVWEKEKNLKDRSSRELAQQKRRQQMMGGIPKLFNQLRLIFQSLNRTVLPKSELIRTILTSHPEITDKGEVEERLQLVMELAPDYIHTRPSHSGELLYRVDKRADVVQIQRRLSGGCGKKLF